MLMDLQSNIQELRDKFRSEKTEMTPTVEVFKNRLDEVEETVNGMEIREQEYREGEAESKLKQQ